MTGVSLSIDEVESVWVFENNRRVSDTTGLNLHFEERASNGLGFGADIGRVSTLISNAEGPRNTENYDASYFGIFMRYPLALGDYFTLQNQLGFKYYTGSTNGADVNDQIEWRDITYQIGLGIRAGNLRLTPFMVFSDTSGDIQRDNRTEVFENEDNVSTGISIDLFLESTSFVRFKFTTSGNESFSLRFASEF